MFYITELYSNFENTSELASFSTSSWVKNLIIVRRFKQSLFVVAIVFSTWFDHVMPTSNAIPSTFRLFLFVIDRYLLATLIWVSKSLLLLFLKITDSVFLFVDHYLLAIRMLFWLWLGFSVSALLLLKLVALCKCHSRMQDHVKLLWSFSDSKFSFSISCFNKW